jgi:hypothetical protein
MPKAAGDSSSWTPGVRAALWRAAAPRVPSHSSGLQRSSRKFQSHRSASTAAANRAYHVVNWSRTRQCKARQGLVPPCTFLYRLIQGYRTFGYFIVLPCTVLYPLTDCNEVLCLKTQYMLVYTSLYWYIPAYTSTYQTVSIVLPCTVLYPLTDIKEVLCLKAQYMLVYILVYTSMYQHRPINQLTSTVCTD